MIRVADHFERTDTGRSRRENEDSFYARAPMFAMSCPMRIFARNTGRSKM